MPKNTGFKCQCVLRSWSNRVVEWLGGFANVITPFFMSLIKLCWQNKKCRTQPLEHSADRQALFWKSSSKKKKKASVLAHFGFNIFWIPCNPSPREQLMFIECQNKLRHLQTRPADHVTLQHFSKLQRNAGRFRKNNSYPSLFDF